MPKFNTEKLAKLSKINAIFNAIYINPKNKKQYPEISKPDVKEILVLTFLLIGDTVMYIPALRVLKANFPNAKITLVGGNLVKSILKDQNLFDDFVVANCPWISPFDKSAKNIINFFATTRILNTKKFDMAIDFRGDWRNIFYLNFVKATRKVSFDHTGGSYMLTDAIHPQVAHDHLIDEEFSLLQAINCSYTNADKIPALSLTDSDEKYLENFIRDFGINDKIVIGIHPGASLEERKWGEKNYAELIIRLHVNNPNHFFLIFEGPDEQQTTSKIKDLIDREHVQSAVIRRSLNEYLILVNECQIMICNDSGAAHVAAAYQIPVVVIFGKGEPAEVQPFGKNTIKIISHPLECKPCHLIYCKFGTNLCMKMVTVDEVYANVIDIEVSTNVLL